MNAALLKALLSQKGDAREIDIRFRIRLPRKQRRCRSALSRRTRSEPPKTERSNLKDGEKTPEIGKITIPDDIMPPEYKEVESHRTVKSSARSTDHDSVTTTKTSNKNSRNSSARSGSSKNSSKTSSRATTARQHSGRPPVPPPPPPPPPLPPSAGATAPPLPASAPMMPVPDVAAQKPPIPAARKSVTEKYKRSPICDELEKLNLSDKSEEVKLKTEEAIEQIGDKISKIDSIQEKTEDASLADAYEEFKSNISNLQSKTGDSEDTTAEQIEAIKSARNAGKKLLRQASQSLFNLLTTESPDQHEHPDSSTSTSSNFNKAKEMFERLSDPENSPTNSPEPSKMMTTRPQSSKPKSKQRNQEEARRARLGCNVCYLSRSETDLTLWNYEADLKSNEKNETQVKIRPKPKKNIYMDLFKEIKELISEVSRLDHAITRESNARKDIENKYAYLLEQ